MFGGDDFGRMKPSLMLYRENIRPLTIPPSTSAACCSIIYILGEELSIDCSRQQGKALRKLRANGSAGRSTKSTKHGAYVAVYMRCDGGLHNKLC